jgi:hypothetical protein
MIFLGLLATFSRTGLLAASGALLLANTIPRALRLLMVTMAGGVAIMSFAIRELDVGALESMDRYWMWAVGLEYLIENAWTHAIAVVPGSAIDVDVPLFLADLWIDQQEKIGVEGIFPFHFHAMWLRLAIGWGWMPAVLLMFCLAYLAFISRYRTPLFQTYFVVFVLLGLTMGLLYLSNVAVPYLLALNFLLTEAEVGRRDRKSLPRVNGMLDSLHLKSNAAIHSMS